MRAARRKWVGKLLRISLRRADAQSENLCADVASKDQHRDVSAHDTFARRFQPYILELGMSNVTSPASDVSRETPLPTDDRVAAPLATPLHDPNLP